VGGGIHLFLAGIRPRDVLELLRREVHSVLLCEQHVLSSSAITCNLVQRHSVKHHERKDPDSHHSRRASDSPLDRPSIEYATHACGGNALWASIGLAVPTRYSARVFPMARRHYTIARGHCGVGGRCRRRTIHRRQAGPLKTPSLRIAVQEVDAGGE
jgi:hypothetical protein